MYLYTIIQTIQWFEIGFVSNVLNVGPLNGIILGLFSIISEKNICQIVLAASGH